MTITERMQEVDRILKGNGGMGMTRTLRPGTLKNETAGDAVIGYSFGLDNLSYRGIWLSTIEDIELKVDGNLISTSTMMLSLNDVHFPISSLEGHTEIFWGAEDECRIVIYSIGGLKSGEHSLHIVIRKRKDFGHSFGEGTENYEEAVEFTNPEIHEDAMTEVIE